MMLRLAFAFFLLLFLAEPLMGQKQDTLKVMHYNILRYGDPNCDKTNEDQNFRNIVDFYKPDILTVNELAADNIYAQRILSKVLNRNKPTGYKKASFTNRNGTSNIVNMLYYNSNKLGLQKQSVSNTQLRDINHYRLFYKEPALEDGKGDTTFLNLSTMHLKAGGGQNNRQKRESMTRNMMDHIANNGYDGHYITTGDFNIAGSNDPGYQNLVDPGPNTPVTFHDPLEIPGTWRKNSQFSDYHTQSTRANNIGDCGVPGGMDDRFDFILIGDETKSQDGPVHYVANSYNTAGQDGNRFNGSITSPTNQKVSSSLANSLKQMSDHLPVLLELAVDQSNSSSTPYALSESFGLTVSPNPFQDVLTVKLPNRIEGPSQLELRQMGGRQVLAKDLTGQQARLNTSGLSPGMYLMTISNSTGKAVHKKLIKR